MNIILNIQRYNPDIDEAPYYQEYMVQIDPNERLLDALMQVKRFLQQHHAHRLHLGDMRQRLVSDFREHFIDRIERHAEIRLRFVACQAFAFGVPP